MTQQKQIITNKMAVLGISKYRLSILTGISQATLSQWFNGKIDISASKFVAILQALGITHIA